MTYSDGTPVYKFLRAKDRKKDCKITWPLVPEEDATPSAMRGEWKVIQDASVEQILENGGAFISAPAGAGKTYLLSQLEVAYKARGFRVIKFSFHHVAADAMGAEETVTRFLHKYARGLGSPAKTVLFWDESSQCPSGLWPLLVNFAYLLGVQFIAAGDFGQQLPISDVWGAKNFLKLEWGDCLWTLSKGLRVELTGCRRCEQEHFDYYCGFRGLNSWDEYPGGQSAAVTELTQKHPWDGQLPDVIFCMSHPKRYWLASWLNRKQRDKAVAEGIPVTLVTTEEPLMHSSMKPHSEIFLWQGAQLMAHTRNARFRNDCPNAVVEVTPIEVVARRAVRPTEGQEGPTPKLLRLSHHDCLQHLRLSCVRVARSVQGMNMKGLKLLLLDAHNQHMEPRTLYVDISRVSSGKLLYVATRAQQTEFMRVAAPQLGLTSQVFRSWKELARRHHSQKD